MVTFLIWPINQAIIFQAQRWSLWAGDADGKCDRHERELWPGPGFICDTRPFGCAGPIKMSHSHKAGLLKSGQR